MSRRQTDKWIRLALISETLRRHGRGKASRLIQVKNQIHRFLARLLWAIGEQRGSDWGEELWRSLMQTDASAWKDIYNEAVRDERRRLDDDPVPKSVIRALPRVELKALAESLEEMPVRARGGDDRIANRINAARTALREVEEELWKQLLSRTTWRSPLLVMDEAHHLKNPATSLARQLQSPDSESDLRTGDGAMAKAFDRMLFLTATPFQLGHHELVNVLQRFGDVRWREDSLGERERFSEKLRELRDRLNESQRSAIGLQRAWCRLRPDDCGSDVEVWWRQLLASPCDMLNSQQGAVVGAYHDAKRSRDFAQQALATWIVRHNKGNHWSGTTILRRRRVDGAAIAEHHSPMGLPIPPDQLLPFFLAARSAADPTHDLLSEALSSSYEAFRFTRQNHTVEKDDQDEIGEETVELSGSRWYLTEFDQALERHSGSAHPKMTSTVRRVVDLWEAGEKVLVFAFYRHTCGALRRHISDEDKTRLTMANVQVAMGTTKREKRARLMRAFNTPFFPDILVCSQVMGEGVDLQRYCRQVIHHDLDWNPSIIEQRTGRVDRLGCKAEICKQPILVYLPYLAGAADERQYRVMSDRERWFRVVMGQDEVARLITRESSGIVSLPQAVSEELAFKLGVGEALSS